MHYNITYSYKQLLVTTETQPTMSNRFLPASFTRNAYVLSSRMIELGTSNKLSNELSTAATPIK